MNVISKWKCESVLSNQYGDEITLMPVSADGIPEHERFHKYTPSGSMKFVVTNPSVVGHYKPGQFYYFTSSIGAEGNNGK